MAERGCGVPGGTGELVVLTPGDVAKLSEQLQDIAAVWDLFVGQLGVPRSKQQQISLKNTNHPAFAQICLVDGLQYWVVSDPSPTVQKVIAALSSRTINNKLLAAEIGRQWGIQEEPVKENTAQPATPGGFATRPVQPNVQAAAVALNPQVKWKGVELQGETLYGVLGDRDVLLITSEAGLPEAVSHTPAPQLSEDARAGYLTSQGVHPDCPLDDLHIMKARYELNKRFEIVGVDQSTLKHPLTTSYVKSTIANVFKNIKKSGVTLYYHGPGRKGTGDWCFADGFITFQDIADLYMKYVVGSVLAINTDCSYSGNWVKSCGEFLDKQGVRPCGHSAHDKGILIKVIASCRADEEAQSLYLSTRVWQNDKNTRALYYNLPKPEDYQHCVTLNSTLILCDSETIEQPCTLPPDHTWQKQLVQEANYEVKNRVYIVHCEVDGRPRWHYLLLPDNKQATAEALFVELQPETRTGILDVRDHGKVLKSGWGEEPPMEVKEWAEKDDFTKYS